MKRIAIALLFSSNALAGATAQTFARQEDPPPGICQGLVAFLQQRGGAVKGHQTPITVEEAMTYAREDNRFACRSALHIMYTTGMHLPAPLLAAIGVVSDVHTGAVPPPPR